MKRSFLNLYCLEVLIAFVFFIAFCIYFIPAPNHSIRVHDSFDGNFTTRHVLVKSGNLFDLNPNSIVPGIMKGLPRGVFPKPTDMLALFMFLFGSLPGYAVTFLLIRIIGFAGIFLFARDHLKIKGESDGIVIMMAIAFACLPVFVVQGLTVLGVPLVLWAFFNLIDKRKILLSIGSMILFALWSQFVLIGVHMILTLSLLFVYFSFQKRQILWWPLFSIIIITVTFVLADYMLFYLHIFDSTYHSSRLAFAKELGLNFKGVLGNTFLYFFRDDYSAASYFGFLFLPFIIYFLYQLFKGEKTTVNSIGFSFFTLLLFCCICISLLDWTAFSWFYKVFPVAKAFNFKRFSNILPGLFHILALVSLISLRIHNKKVNQILTVGLITIYFTLIWRGNISLNNDGFDTTGIKIQKNNVNTFNQFLDPDLFTKIKTVLGKDTLENVVHFGCLSSASKYAGLNVLDDYQGDYPKEYKESFRRVIEGELNKSNSLKKYFDEWGGRCYLESANHFEEKLTRKFGQLFEPELSININQLKRLNCTNIISCIIIGNEKKLGLQLKKVLVSASSFKTYFIYKIL